MTVTQYSTVCTTVYRFNKIVNQKSNRKVANWLLAHMLGGKTDEISSHEVTKRSFSKS